MPSYLDFAATTCVDPRVAEIVRHFMCEEFGNSGSRTHLFGVNARNAVEQARSHVAQVVDCDATDVLFTSGATEANNLAILGLREFGESQDKRHVITTAVEHKAVLEPIEHLEKLGFTTTAISPDASGRITAEAVYQALRPDTVLVSVMHVNNETGVIQPIGEISNFLSDHPAYFHVDAAQGFGKELDLLRNKRVDLLSISGHKLYAPKGIGALIMRRRTNGVRAPLSPLMFGGGQERGLRPGTMPVALVAGLGEAARLSLAEHGSRLAKVRAVEREVLQFVDMAGGVVNGDRSNSTPHIVNASFKGLDSEAFIVATKDLISVSNGAACSSHSYELSHVLRAMSLEDWRVRGAVRFSFSHESTFAETSRLVERVEQTRF
jgi:cysteine desulfurase